MKIKRITPKSLAKVLTILYAVIGFLVGVVTVIANLFKQDSSGTIQSNIMQIALQPIVFGLVGAVSGFLIAWVYNSFAPNLGGIEIDVE